MLFPHHRVWVLVLERLDCLPQECVVQAEHVLLCVFFCFLYHLMAFFWGVCSFTGNTWCCHLMSPTKLWNSLRLSADGADLGPRKVSITFLGCLTSKIMRQEHIFSLGRTQPQVLWYCRAKWRKTCVTPSAFRIPGTWRVFDELVWKTEWKIMIADLKNTLTSLNS